MNEDRKQNSTNGRTGDGIQSLFSPRCSDAGQWTCHKYLRGEFQWGLREGQQAGSDRVLVTGSGDPKTSRVGLWGGTARPYDWAQGSPITKHCVLFAAAVCSCCLQRMWGDLMDKHLLCSLWVFYWVLSAIALHVAARGKDSLMGLPVGRSKLCISCKRCKLDNCANSGLMLQLLDEEQKHGYRTFRTHAHGSASI